MVDKLSKGDPSKDVHTYDMNYIAALNRLSYWKYMDDKKQKK
jgi:hypothetical protein